MAKTKRTSSTSKFDQWLYRFELPRWVKRRLIAPILVLAIFLGGAYFQLNFPLFSKDVVPVNYNSATLTASEQWAIDHYTCDSLVKLQKILESDDPQAEPTLALARKEVKATALILQPWTNYINDKKLIDDWHENSTVIWQRVITLVENFPRRAEPWVEKLEPRLAHIEDFKTYLSIGIEQNDPEHRLADWMILLKRCVYAPVQPAAAEIVVKQASSDSNYCPIYARFSKLNFDDPESISIFAQNNLRLVNDRGLQSGEWSQLETTLSTYLSTMTDAQTSVPSSADWQEFKNLPPMQVITHRLDLLCGA